VTRAIHIAGLLVVSCILAALVSACGPVRHDVAGNDSVRNLPDGDNLLRLEKSLAAIEADLELVAVQRAVLDNELAYTRGLDRHDEVLIDGAVVGKAKVISGGARCSSARLSESLAKVRVIVSSAALASTPTRSSSRQAAIASGRLPDLSDCWIASSNAEFARSSSCRSRPAWRCRWR
jgi:hypothetical protein